MAIMHPENINEYTPTDSERLVYNELKRQLPDTYNVFYSVEWTEKKGGKLLKSEADFIVTNPNYGYLCLEVKGGDGIYIDGDTWYLEDRVHGDRRLPCSPYAQADKNMYHFRDVYSNETYMKYPGIFGSAVVFPFYPIDDNLQLDSRNRICTIDCDDLNHLENKIKKLFRFWAGDRYGRIFYTDTQHKALLNIIHKRLAIAAAAGALVKYKEQQLDVINRVQDNYIYFISNIRQFFVRGGAGTGKTWIAMKVAEEEARKKGQSVMFLCASPKLAEMVNERIGEIVDVFDIRTLFGIIVDRFEQYDAPLYSGIINDLKSNIPKYDAIIIDEAQDFTEEWARMVKLLLVNPDESRLGVFYDDVQVFREDSFGDGFNIDGAPYLLRENIRNTANIYNWTAEKTNLGTDVIANPVEGPEPTIERIQEEGQLTLFLENTFHKFLLDEYLPNTSLIVLTDDVEWLLDEYSEGIASWRFTTEIQTDPRCIRVASIEDFKGLESDMVIYLHGNETTDNQNYIAYTRAKYYLIEIIITY